MNSSTKFLLSCNHFVDIQVILFETRAKRSRFSHGKFSISHRITNVRVWVRNNFFFCICAGLRGEFPADFPTIFPQCIFTHRKIAAQSTEAFIAFVHAIEDLWKINSDKLDAMREIEQNFHGLIHIFDICIGTFFLWIIHPLICGCWRMYPSAIMKISQSNVDKFALRSSCHYSIF